MSRNGSGTAIPPAGQPVVTATNISSTVENVLVNDIYNELTNSIARDGQSPATANIPMGGFRITGVADPVANQDADTKAARNAAIATSGVRPNRIINGDMRIDQRNNFSLQIITDAAALAYTADRWYAYCSGSNVVGVCAGFGRYQFSGAAGTTNITFAQRIERNDSYDLAGKTITIGVSTANSLLNSVAWALYYANTADTFGTRAAPTRTAIANGTFTVNAGFGAYYAQVAVPSAADTGLELVLSVGAQISGTWQIGNIELLEATGNIPFSPLAIALEWDRCRRFYKSGTYGFILPITNVSVVGNYYSWIDFGTRMRIAPTITGTNAQGGVFDVASITQDGALIGRSDVIANRANSGTYAADAEL